VANEDRVVFEAVLAAQREGRAAALVTIVQTEGSVPRQPGSKMLVWADGGIVGTVGGGEVEAHALQMAHDAQASGQPCLMRYNLGDPEAGGGTVHLFVEPLLPLPTLVVIGCGHVGKAVAELAKWMDFRVIVADDRAGYATPDQVPGMDAYVEAPPAELVARLHVTPRTYVVAVTRGVDIDRDLLPPLLATETPYIGLIGSRRRWTATAEALAALGIDDLSRIHTPVGLELNAETPKEIALSILAEVVMIVRGAAKTPEAPRSMQVQDAQAES
jgi:xanthine dehydrogenase accessory factor